MNIILSFCLIQATSLMGTIQRKLTPVVDRSGFIQFLNQPRIQEHIQDHFCQWSFGKSLSECKQMDLKQIFECYSTVNFFNGVEFNDSDPLMNEINFSKIRQRWEKSRYFRLILKELESVYNTQGVNIN